MAAGALAGGAYLWALGAERARLALALKPLPVLCLAVWVAFGAQDDFAWLMVAGLGVSLVADVLIERSFLAGLGAFLVAHLAYIAAFLTRTTEPRLLFVLPFALWGVVVVRRLWPALGGLRWPVVAYAGVICAMMWRAAAGVGAEGAPRAHEWMALAGAVLFAASDTLIAFDRFLAPREGVAPGSPLVRYPIMLLYWAGQLLLALSTRAR